MQLAQQYAKALLSIKNPGQETLRNLGETLKRRGHQKLLPSIYKEYERLLTKEERLTRYKTVTPEKERTRILYELYTKLIHNG